MGSRRVVGALLFQPKSLKSRRNRNASDKRKKQKRLKPWQRQRQQKRKLKKISLNRIRMMLKMAAMLHLGSRLMKSLEFRAEIQASKSLKL